MSTSKFKKFAVPGALVVGGITAGSFLAPIGLASAQDDSGSDAEAESTEADTTEAESSDAEGRRSRPGRGHDHGERSEVLTETLGLTSEEIREGFEAGKSLADMAAEQGVDVADLQAAMVAQASERIDDAVEAGKIDADEAAEKLAEAETKIGEMINANPEDFQGRSGRSGMGHRGKGHGAKMGANFEAIEEALGLTGEEIRAAMAEGQSLSDIAAAQGVSVESLAAIMTEGIEERIDAAVEAGKIDADKAAEAKANIDDKVEDMLTREFDGERAGRGEGRRGHRGNRFGPGADGATDDSGEVVESSYSA